MSFGLGRIGQILHCSLPSDCRSLGNRCAPRREYPRRGINPFDVPLALTLEKLYEPPITFWAKKIPESVLRLKFQRMANIRPLNLFAIRRFVDSGNMLHKLILQFGRNAYRPFRV